MIETSLFCKVYNPFVRVVVSSLFTIVFTAAPPSPLMKSFVILLALLSVLSAVVAFCDNCTTAVTFLVSFPLVFPTNNLSVYAPGLAYNEFDHRFPSVTSLPRVGESIDE